MADRYSNRPLSAADHDRGYDQHGATGGESDPLAELARLIGQTDPFGAAAKPSAPPRRPAAPPQPYYPPAEPEYEAEPDHHDASYEDEPQPSLPSWMQRANLQRPGEQAQADAYDDEQPNSVHPLHRYAARSPAPAYQDDHYGEPQDHADHQQDPARYDDALYGALESGEQDFQREPAYPDDPYAYQDGYEDQPQPALKRRGGLMTVAAVLALAVVGTGAAFAYRSFVGSPRSGEPPIIKADNSPTKVVPASDASGKTPDRLPGGDGSEKMVSREETPVDVNSRAAGPRVVLPPLNQNPNPPTVASVSSNVVPPAQAGAAPSNGTLANGEPRKIKTFSVRGDQPDAAAAAVVKPAAKPPTAPRAQIPASNAPLSLSPDSAQASLPPPAPARVASTAPTQLAPDSDASTPAADGRFLVSITSQPTAAEATSSFKAMQRKYPDQLGSRTPIIKKIDGKNSYRALVGPFASRADASRFCTSYSSAGGQCWVP